MLLSGDESDLLELGTSVSKGLQARKDQLGLADFGASLLEPLLKALDQQPERLDQIEDLVKDLQKTAEGRALLTEEFLETWRSISGERQAAGNE